MTEPGEQVLALWPGFLFESHARPVPGLENHFAFLAARRMSGKERERYHVLSLEDVRDMIKKRVVRVVVLSKYRDTGGQLEKLALKAGCRLMAGRYAPQSAAARIYARP